ncbi:MAG TPA: signal peptidase II [Polyangiaceae bacterium]
MRASRRLFLCLLACVACLVGCDHATKLAAETTLRDHAPVVLAPGVDLLYTENRGIAFSALERLSLHPPASLLVALALLETAVVLAVWLRRPRASRVEHAGFALVVGGALGNAIDRAARGHVVDFIHVHLWPVFNVADVLVVAGLLLLVAHSMCQPLPPATPEGGPPPSPPPDFP